MGNYLPNLRWWNLGLLLVLDIRLKTNVELDP